jgi:hypothetical protein
MVLVSYQGDFYPKCSVVEFLCILAQYGFFLLEPFFSILLSLSVAGGLIYLAVSVTHYSCAESTVLPHAANANKTSYYEYARFA